jgi:hypothetical protein
MKFSLFLILALAANVFAYTDTDMDGVDDAQDRCPNTPMDELVNTQGCTLTSLKHQYDIIVGGGYSQLNYANNAKDDTFTATLQADYYNQNFSAQILSSHYTSNNDSGMNDTLIAGYYQIPLSDLLSVNLGGGILLPTYETGYDNEATDYMGSIGLTFLVKPQVALVAGYSYTFVNDNDVDGILNYQNTPAYYLGANYLIDSKLSVGGVYQYSESIYRDVEAIKKVSGFGMYRFDSHWFTNATYSYGLSDSASDHSIDLRIGYSF